MQGAKTEEKVDNSLELALGQANWRRAKLDPFETVRQDFRDAGEPVPSDKVIRHMLEEGYLQGSMYGNGIQ